MRQNIILNLQNAIIIGSNQTGLQLHKSADNEKIYETSQNQFLLVSASDFFRQYDLLYSVYPHRQHLFMASQEQDSTENRLLVTPMKSQCTPISHCWKIDPVLAYIGPKEEQSCSQQVLQNSESCENQYYQNYSPPQINLKIDFSKEDDDDLLIALTPQKKPIVQEEYEYPTTTVRRRVEHSPNASIDMRFCERGLKKLAYEAFIFVSSQKRTTYKQVARKLISQMMTESSLEIEKKGEMNIKRRVYDALNVLIALGLLKRNGNKIIVKRNENIHSFQTSNQRQSRLQRVETKDQELYQQCVGLKQELMLKHNQLINKQKLLQSLKVKLTAIKQLSDRNRNAQKGENTIDLPFLVLCGKQKEAAMGSGSRQRNVSLWQQNGELVAMKNESKQRNISIWQQNGGLRAMFETNAMHIMGDMDCFALAKSFSQIPEKLERPKRLRNR